MVKLDSESIINFSLKWSIIKILCRVSNSRASSIVAFSTCLIFNFAMAFFRHLGRYICYVGTSDSCACLRIFPVPGTSTHNFPFPFKRHVKWNLAERRVNCALRAVRVWLGASLPGAGAGARLFGCSVHLFVRQPYGHVCAGICRYPLRSVAAPQAFSNNECAAQVSVVINLICTAKTSQIHFLCHKFLCPMCIGLAAD